MNRGALLFLGVFLALGSSWCGMVLLPQLQVGRLQQTNTVTTAEAYPTERPGLARQGLEVYRANGCSYCHSQQVRPTIADLERWGKRRTVATDYLFDYPLMLGSRRIGSDLTNIGVRARSEEWHLLHLYNPRSVVPDSTMPPYRYLFSKRKMRVATSPEALKLTGAFAPEPGSEIVPKSEVQALIAYLLSLHSEAALFEAAGLPPPSPLPESSNVRKNPPTNRSAP
jgi:cytochrome c oxidase cbb3-type subunit 2